MFDVEKRAVQTPRVEEPNATRGLKTPRLKRQLAFCVFLYFNHQVHRLFDHPV
jgi:hypothetical protein